MSTSISRNDSEDKQADQVAREILAVLLPRRRTTDDDGPTPDDWPVQLAKIRTAVERRIPIDFIIPGFPCKSPNPAKVAGTLPDEAERVALHVLNEICSQISHVHPPGARVTICSDGHVFTDIIGVDDETIVEYNDALVKMIADEGLSHLSTFDLREIWGDGDFAAKRHQLDTQWAPALDDIRADVKAGGNSARLLRGMTRFMIADTVDWAGTKSQLQKNAKQRAYQLIRFSTAWGNILDIHFPEAVRLSIHPQPRLSPKLGIKLIAPDDDIWTTPWHSVLVYDTSGRPRLTSHAEARAKYVPVHQDGSLSHFIEQPLTGCANAQELP
ncbi:isocyanide synthase family protein [Gordonia sp. VNK1]|uniref:isocyanide synthase family protein n=1 Tax=Gordonia oleivorans TaxID=3156618 RepID=UPI0032B59140